MPRGPHRPRRRGPGFPGLRVAAGRGATRRGPGAGGVRRLRAGYAEAVEAVLLAPRTGGAIVPGANRAAFDASIQEALDALADELVEALGDGPANPTATEVVEAIVGEGPDSLESRLLELSARAIDLIAEEDPSTVEASDQSGTSTTAIPGPAATPGAPTTPIPIPQAPAASVEVRGPSAAAASTDAAGEVRKAFGAFLEDYFRAVDDVLLADPVGGRVPEAARDEFDARVDRALRWLGDGLYVTFRRNPAASALAPGVREAIGSEGPESLRTRLRGLTTPDGPQAAIVREFTMGSVKVVAEALSLIAGDLAEALGAP